MTSRLLTLSAAAVLLAVLPAFPQQALESRTALAMVTDTGNRSLDILEPDDFVVSERGEPREILSVHLADYPVALLLDNSTSNTALDVVRVSARRFISRLGERPIAVSGLTLPPTLAAGFDDDRAAVLAAIDRLPNGGGPPAPLESAAAAAQTIRQTGAPFSAIVIISSAPADVNPETRGELLTSVLDSAAMVHVVGLRIPGAGGVQADLLHALADQTHGQFTTIFSSASYAVAVDRLADRMSAEMMIEYVVPPGSTPGGDVRVGVKIPGAKVQGMGVR